MDRAKLPLRGHALSTVAGHACGPRAATGVAAGRRDQRAGLVSGGGGGRLRRAVGKMFKGKKIEKGIAFPTCVSVNRWASLPPEFIRCSADRRMVSCPMRRLRWERLYGLCLHCAAWSDTSRRRQRTTPQS